MTETSWDELVREGTELVQSLAGEIWTSFGPGDAGVTILHQFCHGLTSLNYELGMPVEDLLASPDGQEKSAIPSPGEALARDPIARDDQRRLLIDRLPGLGNAWLEPRRNACGDPTGVQAIFLYAAPPLPGVHEEASPRPGLAEQAARLFGRCRPLGEDVDQVVMMKPAVTRVEAMIEMDGSAHSDSVMAAALVALASWLTPEPRRRGLRSVLAAGEPLGPLLRGPAPANGLIDLPPPPRRRLDLDGVRIRLAGVRGVLAVERLAVTIDGERLSQGTVIELEPARYFSLDSGLERDEPGLTLTLASEAQPADTPLVMARLRDFWAELRRPRDTQAEFEGLRIATRAPHLSSFPSTASGLPAVYGVGARGCFPDAPPERRAQAKQLSGYLGLFDYLLAGMHERLAALGALTRARPADALPSRPLIEILPELGPLLHSGKAERIDLYDLDAAESVADLVLALRGEDELLIPIPPGLSAEAAQQRRIAVKRDLALALGHSGRADGGELDRTAPALVGGTERRCRILLGCRSHFDRASRPLLMIADHVMLGGAARPMSATALVHLADPAWDKAPFRAAVEAMVRANVPAHIAVETRFVDRPGLVAFCASYRRLLRGGRKRSEALAGSLVERLERWDELVREAH
jgi:hypothetical protein